MEMTTQYAIEGNNITKNLKGFNLDIDDLKVPKGFATALIGENGAGKTTLLNIPEPESTIFRNGQSKTLKI